MSALSSVRGWLSERGMGASVLVAALSTSFGVILLTATRYLDAVLRADPAVGKNATLAILLAIVTALILAVVVYVAAVVTANTFAAIIAGRTRQIALLRLLGASARSERRRVAGQGLVVGLIGSVLGLGVGLAGAVATPGALANYLPAVPLDPWTPTLLLPAVTVAATTWAAAWTGSRRVLPVTPLQAVAATVESPSTAPRQPLRDGVALGLIALGVLLLAVGVVVGLRTGLGVVVAFVGGVISFSGFALAATRLIPPVLGVTGRLFGRGVASRLAVAEASRHPERSARTAIGVVIGVTLVTMFPVATESARAVVTSASGGTIEPSLTAAMNAFAVIMTALVGVAAVVAAVGLVNLLTIGIVQRRRELGLLRTIGLAAPQVRRMVLVEAAHLALTAVGLGLLLGIGYGWVAAQSLLGSIQGVNAAIGYTLVAPTVPWPTVAGIGIGALVLTLLASVTPTRVALRATPVEALADV